MTDMMDGGRSPGSTIAASEMDDTLQSSPVRPDPRTSLQHVLGSPMSRQQSLGKNGDMTEDEEPETVRTAPKKGGTKGGRSKAKSDQPHAAVNGSIFIGNKVKHLKKDDGEPLWRKDIQYDFLKAIFDDSSKVFTNSYEPDTIGKQNFADLYIDAMARSSKTSKILRDKLLSEHEPAKNMAMVCLLVNLGRMNTTLNFFPEMRAQLRTYHAIPSLQAHQDPNSYKQLQDAPRLKSILKGASEDRPEPNSCQKIKELDVPRTNPVNLIFVLAQNAVKVTELHFPIPRDFNDLIMKTTLSSASRARAFLWLMWHYLESDFTEEGAAENPFGAGVDYGQGVSNQGVPELEILTAEQAELENIDIEEEIKYGTDKQKERGRIIEADLIAFNATDQFGPPKRGPKPKLNLPPEDGASPASVISFSRNRVSKYDSDVDSTRSTPPPRAPNMRIQSVINSKGRGSAPIRNQIVGSSSPAPPGGGHLLNTPDTGPVTRRSRPLTAHQLAVEHNRNQRINYILSRGLRKKHHQAKKLRRVDGAIYRSLMRMGKKDDEFEDSESEESLNKDSGGYRERGFRGLVQLSSEEDDFGEELSSYAAAFRRMGRRLERWDQQEIGGHGAVSKLRPIKIKPKKITQGEETEDDQGEKEDIIMGDEGDDLDDMDRQLLGIDASEGEDADEGDGDEDLEDAEKDLLELEHAGDETEDELTEMEE